jgi:integrase
MSRKKSYRPPQSGSISTNPSGSIRAQYSLPGGKRLTKSFRTKREAEAWLREIGNQVTLGMDSLNHSKLVSEFVSEWLVRKKLTVKPKTLFDYTRYCERFIVPILGELKIREIKLPTVNAFYARLIQDGATVEIIRHTHRVLFAIFADAVRQGYLLTNPAQYADVPAKEQNPEKIKIFSAAEYETFIQATHSSNFGVLYRLAISTGMRQGELLGLTWRNVELERGEIRVIQQLSRYGQSGSRFEFAPLKTAYSKRTLKISAELTEMLQQHARSQQEYSKFMGSKWQENDLLFTSTIGTPLDQRNMQRDFDKMLKSFGLPKLRFHDLRHNTASTMIARGFSIVQISRYLGHSSPNITLEIYAHLIPGGFEDLNQPLEKASRPNHDNFPAI